MENFRKKCEKGGQRRDIKNRKIETHRDSKVGTGAQGRDSGVLGLAGPYPETKWNANHTCGRKQLLVRGKGFSLA